MAFGKGGMVLGKAAQGLGNTALCFGETALRLGNTALCSGRTALRFEKTALQFGITAHGFGETALRLGKTALCFRGRMLAFASRKSLKTDFLFAPPHHSWEGGSNENTNGLLRPYLPKVTDLAGLSQSQCNCLSEILNNLSGKSLGYKTPNEVN
jgi:hypothetical protein